MSIHIAYITFPNKEEAKKLAIHLIESKLIACANIYPIDSIYTWEGKVQEDSEFVLWCKTNLSQMEKLRSEVIRLHSYDVPCIVDFPAESEKAYGNWLIDQLNN